MALHKPHRHRSSSDPFSDPTAVSYSSYGVPTLASYQPQQQQQRRAPPVPPKVPAKTSTRQHTKPAMATEIVTTSRSSSDQPRTRVSRSQTQVPPPMAVRPATAPTRRSHSQDSIVVQTTTADKGKGTSRRNPAKKGSSHADVIDRLDYSGVGGPMFHHDGPFDACAPSRNRHKTKAPMFAWTGTAQEDKEALASAREIPSYQSPYPSPGVYAPYEAPKKKHDAIAEAWGIHEPEPFEDFSAGGGYSAGGIQSEYQPPSSRHGTASSRRGKDSQPRRQQTKRSPIPPPQPIFAPEGDPEAVVLPPSPTGPSSPGAPKRTKSLMHRIRKMRENPMVPPLNDETPLERDNSPPSPTENGGAQYAQRPTHRSQNSFLGGIFGGQKNRDMPSPTEEAYVYVDDAPANGRREKSLPRPPVSPRDANGDGYFDAGYNSSGGGLGRKTSLLKKVKTAVNRQGPANK
ncbi:hypothetical protein BDW22DRAFT_1320112 [Trametopsis cervina]|nr:hypothetical protein BDW22DRAFT_1320112 [Trametopsis cervina]